LTASFSVSKRWMFGEAVALGLEAHVYCPTCFRTRQVGPTSARLRDRCFAGTRFRCASLRWNGKTCGGLGSVTIQPTELPPEKLRELHIALRLPQAKKD
jgi:hypothetical protein